MSLDIVEFRPEHAEAFREINLEWIEGMFSAEALDLEILENPERFILEPGGRIMVALLEGEPVGVGALMQVAPGCFELTKMGVRPAAQGHSAGARLLLALIAKARALNARELYLLSSTRCEAAVHLYQKHGFRHDPDIMERYGKNYSRCNVAMSFPLNPDSAADSSA